MPNFAAGNLTAASMGCDAPRRLDASPWRVRALRDAASRPRTCFDLDKRLLRAANCQRRCDNRRDDALDASPMTLATPAARARRDAGRAGSLARRVGAPDPRAASASSGSPARSRTSRARPPGHCYFTLKDAHGAGALRVLPAEGAVRSTFALHDGLAVEVRATPSIYEARGEFQLNVDAVRLAGHRRAVREVRAAQGEARGGRLVRRRAQAPAARVSARDRHRDVAARGRAVATC